jgi:hypothetical protein
MLAAERKQMAAYPEKDPRLYPFTGRVPLPPDAEAKEARLHKLTEDIDSLHFRIASLPRSLIMPRQHLQGILRDSQAEREALLASVE